MSRTYRRWSRIGRKAFEHHWDLRNQSPAAIKSVARAIGCEEERAIERHLHWYFGDGGGGSGSLSLRRRCHTRQRKVDNWSEEDWLDTRSLRIAQRKKG